MPKKSPKNSFFYFMLDFKNQEAKKGRNISLAQSAHEAGHIWSKMGPEERYPYELRANKERKESKPKKYTTMGQDIDLVLKREKEKQDSETAMHQAIENIVLGSLQPSELEFYVGYVNYYCYCTSLNRYLPAEISIVRFSLKNGVDLDDIFHVILDTGTLPIGYRLVATKHSEETHDIPLPPHDESEMRDISEKDMRKVLESMIEFLQKNSTSKNSLPPVYFEPTNMPIASNVFQNLISDYGDSSIKEIKIYSLLHLFYQLNVAAKKSLFPLSIAQVELERDVYDYVKGISCEYHSVSDNFPFCSLSHSIRKIFVICDNTNSAYGIQLIAGKHVPKNSCAERLIHHPGFQQDEAAALPPRNNLQNIEPDCQIDEQIPCELKPKESPKKTLRLPMSKSFTQTYQDPNVSNLSSTNFKNDFPALGGGDSDNRNRPAAIGRGRGRILQNK